MKRDAEDVGLRLVPFPDGGRSGDRPPPEGIIRVLEDLIERARQGEFSGLAIVTITPEGHVGTGWAFGDAGWDRHRMYAGANLLERRIYEELYEAD